MRSGKRVLAGVAAGALGAGLLVLGVSPAQAASPTDATVTPVRYSETVPGSQDSVPKAVASWSTTDDSLTNTNTVTLLAAPVGGTLTVNASDTVTVGTPRSNVTITQNVAGTVQSVQFSVNRPGVYAGTIVSTGEQVNFSFATTGAPKTMTLTPGYATTPLSTPTTLTVTLFDAAGNVTQPANGDGVAISSSPAGATIDDTVLTTADLYAGTFDIKVSSGAPNTYAVSAIPGGSLPSAGITTQTSYVLVSGAISDDTVTAQAVVAPAAHRNGAPSDTGPLFTSAVVQSGSSPVTIAFKGAANATVRYAVWTSAGTVAAGGNGPTAARAGTPIYVDTTTDRNGEGLFEVALAGAAISPDSILTVQQARGNNALGPAAALNIRMVRDISAYATLVLPQGNQVAALGQSLPVFVAAQDLFGNPAPNVKVFAYRTTYNSTPISSGTTDAEGIGTLSVTNAASATNGTTETYLFSIQRPDGSITLLNGTDPDSPTNQNLIVRYTTTGAITSLVAPTSPTTVTVSGKITQQPLITVPDDGYVTSATSDSINPQTGEDALAATGEYFTVTPLASPGTNLLLTAPEGVKLVDPRIEGGLPSTTNPVLWSGGRSTVIVPNGTPVAVFATKTGEHSITVTPYGGTAPSVTVPFTAVNNRFDGYTLTAEPTKITVDNVSFTNFKVSVKDIFGNPVPGAYVEGKSTGDILLGGLNDGDYYFMGRDGSAMFTVIALRNAGAGKVELEGFDWNVNDFGYVVPPGAPTQPVTTATVDVTIQPKADASITIVGERGNVGGKTGIKVDGGSTGFVTGTEMTPMVRFPGQTEYTAGTARPTTNAAGDFSWQRKTGKKTYVYFMSGSVNSNRIIIAAK